MQLKQTNLIFLEHNKLKLEAKELYNKIEVKEELINKLNLTISNKDMQLNNYVEIDKLYNQQLKSKDLKLRKYKTIIIGSVCVSVSLVILLLIK